MKRINKKFTSLFLAFLFVFSMATQSFAGVSVVVSPPTGTTLTTNIGSTFTVPVVITETGVNNIGSMIHYDPAVLKLTAFTAGLASVTAGNTNLTDLVSPTDPAYTGITVPNSTTTAQDLGYVNLQWFSTGDPIATGGTLYTMTFEAKGAGTSVIELLNVNGAAQYADAGGSAITVSGTNNASVTVQMTANGAVIADANALTFDSFKGTNTAADNVTANLVLPATGANGTTITWATTNGGVNLSANGTVTRPTALQGDKSVTLTATIAKTGATSQTKKFDLVIKALPPLTDSEAVTADTAALVFNAIKGTNTTTTAIMTNLTLPTTGTNGTTITWATTSAGGITTNGVVTRPIFPNPDLEVTLTATVTKGTVTQTVTFVLTVKAGSPVATTAVTITSTASTITANGGTLTLTAAATPSNAPQSFTWSITAGNSFASIDPTTGVLTALGNGTVTVRATSNVDNTKYGTKNIVITGQVADNLTDLTATGFAMTFAPTTYAYTADVAKDVTSVSLTPTAAAGTTVKINGTAVTGATTVNLLPGPNVITLVVSQPNKTDRTYTITVTRAYAYLIANATLTTSPFLKASADITGEGKAVVVFQFMNGNTPVGMQAVETTFTSTAQTVSAMMPGLTGSTYTVKIMVLDQLSVSLTQAGVNLANPIAKP